MYIKSKSDHFISHYWLVTGKKKKKILKQIGVEIVWDNVDRMNGSWDTYLASPADFAGADGIVTNLAKEKEPGIEIIECIP